MGKYDTKYVGAPYNFIPFADVRQVYADRPPAHNSMDQELISGEIEYEMTAQTPIFTDNGEEFFHRDANGNYSIPGSSIRGLIRNNVQILGYSSFDDDIDDYALMYRDVTDIEGNVKSIYKTATKGVKAGYIKKEGSGYSIYSTNEKGDYYTLSEREDIQKDYYDKRDNNGVFSYPFFKEPDGWKTQNNLEFDFEESEKEEGGKRRKHYIGEPNDNYKPYFEEVSYEINNKKKITKVGAPNAKYSKKGYVISSGYVEEKKAVYILPEVDTKSAKPISEEDLAIFKADYQKKENTLGEEKDFFNLPKDEKLKPVFYLEHDGHTYIGFTPKLRIFYKHRIKDGLPDKQRNKVIDYAKSMFGYSDDEKSYKSRVSFSDAVICEKDQCEQRERTVVLSDPKPSSYMDYLIQTGETTNYNSENFELRGVKQYWLHKKLVAGGGTQEEGTIENEKVLSTLRPLPKNVHFTGKVRFKNLKKDELGLLLWAIRLEKDSWMNLGKAKSYGYGCVSVQIKSAKKINYQKAYDLQSMLELTPFETINVQEAIDTYKKQASEWCEAENIDDEPHIRAFFDMKDSTKIPDEEDIRYMSVDASEYQTRTVPLPSINEVIKKKK